MESYDSLRRMLGFDRELPVDPNWSAAADFLHVIARHCLANQPANIVECSSGLTTLALAGCCRLNGLGHVYSLENGAEYAEATRALLDELSLAPFATVIHAPLESSNIEGNDYLWYRLDDLKVPGIDMLVIDGPPGFLQKHSRYPALPLLHHSLSKNCTVFLDDAARDDEKEVVERWRRLYPSADYTDIKTERGCAVLSFSNSI